MGYIRFKTCALTFWRREKVKEWIFLNTSWKFFKIYETYQVIISKWMPRSANTKKKHSSHIKSKLWQNERYT